MDKDIVDGFAGKKVLVIGDYCIDEFFEGEANSVSPEAPILRVLVNRIFTNPGMTGTVARGFQALGAETYASGVIGEDNASRGLVKAFQESGINTDGLVLQQGRITSKFSRVMVGGKKYPKQSAIRYDIENNQHVNELTTQKLIDYIDSIGENLDAIVVEDYDEVGMGVVTPRLLESIVRTAEENNLVLIGDSRINFNRFRNFKCLTPNIYEARLAYGKDDRETASVEKIAQEMIKRLSLYSVLIKRDKDGLDIFTRNGKRESIPALAKKVVDVTGAGDNVACAFTLGLCSGFDYFESARLASYAAAIAVSKPGVAVATSEELKEFIEAMNHER